MSVQSIQNHAIYQSPLEIRGVQKQGAVSEPVTQDDKPSKISERPVYDEYIPGEKPEPVGLHKAVHDEQAAPAKGEPERKAETCTTNTDKVDREIEKLKEKREQLKQQIRTTEDSEKVEKLKRQLAQVENELRQKDNDAYRRQNAVIS